MPWVREFSWWQGSPLPLPKSYWVHWLRTNFDTRFSASDSHITLVMERWLVLYWYRLNIQTSLYVGVAFEISVSESLRKSAHFFLKPWACWRRFSGVLWVFQHIFGQSVLSRMLIPTPWCMWGLRLKFLSHKGMNLPALKIYIRSSFFQGLCGFKNRIYSWWCVPSSFLAYEDVHFFWAQLCI